MEPKTNQGTVQPSAESQPVVQPTTQPVQPVTEPVVQPASSTEPDRTQEQFSKLLDSNKRLFDANELLREELQKRTVVNQTFAPIQQQVQPTQPQVNPEDFMEVDPESGDKFVNAEKLQSKIVELNERATRAEQSVQNYIRSSEDRETARQNQEAFQAHEELNPSSEKFDVEFHRQTRALIYDSLINPQDYGGRPLEFKQAADKVKSQGVSANIMAQAEGSEVTPQAKEGVKEQEESQTLKEQGSLEATGQPQSQANSQLSQEAELADLQERTRQGDDLALAQRIMNTDHIKPKAEEETAS